MSHNIPFPDPDLFQFTRLLNKDEQAYFAKVQKTLQEKIRPAVGTYWDKEEFPFELLDPLAEVGLGELEFSGYSRLLKGMIYAEVTRADVSLSALVGIHNELIVDLINEFGSTEQKDTWLPGLRQFRNIGCFALTEPDHGSDIAGGLATTATPTDDGWIINGQKRWIGAGTICDFAIVFARDTTDNEIKGFIVEKERDGFSAQKIDRKMGLRIMQNADLHFENVLIPRENLIPGTASFAQTNILLRNSRAWVGWQGAGVQLAIFDSARNYVLDREQFGKPLAKYQLVQEPLSRILGNAMASYGMLAQIAWLQDNGGFDMVHAALAKATTTRLARESAAAGRALAGGNGILTQYELSKLLNDVEILYTYEGTYEINSLIVGRAITGLSAFK
ncbi:acyl-CoA dehydrogenase [Corynebacterium sp. sy017]|uniref:acyl-CoA dehydrogenase family protein n=1 Tax=unclassified Corynebacterium TaxID=2624378 RepID=UPI001184AF75|nr:MULTISPECIES: acyl-CoA dehydrogenase family protein [unclassified Corynebacterium]MBP3088814.1 acyl-CoA dehydrogenase [Corynebacterium sp. sy017]QDZ42205.1 acyl-CoA dehydrogenase [Corynebacterium sp. sy039]TSD91157.1 acyl-CoA dehydrogenase [Corynebacterium sp. SY003]